jgi:hypothetical protein
MSCLRIVNLRLPEVLPVVGKMEKRRFQKTAGGFVLRAGRVLVAQRGLPPMVAASSWTKPVAWLDRQSNAQDEIDGLGSVSGDPDHHRGSRLIPEATVALSSPWP